MPCIVFQQTQWHRGSSPLQKLQNNKTTDHQAVCRVTSKNHSCTLNSEIRFQERANLKAGFWVCRVNRKTKIILHDHYYQYYFKQLAKYSLRWSLVADVAKFDLPTHVICSSTESHFFFEWGDDYRSLKFPLNIDLPLKHHFSCYYHHYNFYYY